MNYKKTKKLFSITIFAAFVGFLFLSTPVEAVDCLSGGTCKSLCSSDEDSLQDLSSCGAGQNCCVPSCAKKGGACQSVCKGSDFGFVNCAGGNRCCATINCSANGGVCKSQCGASDTNLGQGYTDCYASGNQYCCAEPSCIQQGGNCANNQNSCCANLTCVSGTCQNSSGNVDLNGYCFKSSSCDCVSTYTGSCSSNEYSFFSANSYSSCDSIPGFDQCNSSGGDGEDINGGIDEEGGGGDGFCPAGSERKYGICAPTGSGLSTSPIHLILSNLLSWILGIFGFIALIAFIISGIQYLTSAGEEKTLETAKRNMRWSIIGVIVGLAGLVIVYAISAALEASSLI